MYSLHHPIWKALFYPMCCLWVPPRETHKSTHREAAVLMPKHLSLTQLNRIGKSCGLVDSLLSDDGGNHNDCPKRWASNPIHLKEFSAGALNKIVICQFTSRVCIRCSHVVYIEKYFCSLQLDCVEKATLIQREITFVRQTFQCSLRNIIWNT